MKLFAGEEGCGRIGTAVAAVKKKAHRSGGGIGGLVSDRRKRQARSDGRFRAGAVWRGGDCLARAQVRCKRASVFQRKRPRRHFCRLRVPDGISVTQGPSVCVVGSLCRVGVFALSVRVPALDLWLRVPQGGNSAVNSGGNSVRHLLTPH